MAAPQYPGFRQGEPEIERIKKLNNLLQGKQNNSTHGSVTLTANQATSTLTDPLLTPNSVIVFMPTTANAAAELGNGTLYVSARTAESATLAHANNAQADRTFEYRIFG